MLRIYIPVLMLALIGGSPVLARADELAAIEGVDFREVASRLFSLDSEQEIAIEATVWRSRRNVDACDAWILDRQTRRVMWDLDDADRKRRSRGTVTLEDEVKLPAGEYELYLSAFPDDEWGDFSLRGLFRLITRGGDHWSEHGRGYDDLAITVRAPDGRSGGENTVRKVREVLEQDAIVAFTGVGDDEHLRTTFALAEETELEVYALGEARRDGIFDGAWIMDADTGKRMWDLDFRHSDRAGGNNKNRLVRKELRLPAGRYVAFYVSDDSHSWPDFNTQPPRDPMAWGVTIRPVDRSQIDRISRFDYEDPLERNVLVDLTRVRNDRHISRGFTLPEDALVRIFAVGEGRRGRMYDYGWMVDARSRDVVWEMEYGNTEPAGGDEKNRQFDGARKLKAGSYIVYFVTDGSHSYRRWNTSPPMFPDRWGITITLPGDEFAVSEVTDYDPDDDPGVLARIAEVGNRDFERRNFTLDRDQDVLIYAVGEGERRRMFDYGWVEDEDGDLIWRMPYRKTKHAGGARKNRSTRKRLSLEAGSYRIFYESDGSHSYQRWNADPPRDPEAWGITVFKTN